MGHWIVTSPASVLMAERGTQWVDTSHEAADALRRLLAEGRRFFSLPTASKAPLAAKGSMTGWRSIGIEYSRTPDRPDLNETFCYRHRDDAMGALPMSAMLERCREAQEVLDGIAAEQLAALAEHVGVGDLVERVRTGQESWLQLNWSLPSSLERDFIQDAHEDGHLITLLMADAEGLEVLDPRDGWTPVMPTPEQLICFAGECAALLTSDAVTPMMHQVRAHPEVQTRLSVAYFVNPDLDQELRPWVNGPRNAGVDLLHWGQENPMRFGLPRL
jgi:isopenicillin N synthase-like dioxygenase